MKILMLGWELPPHNSGGLGVACYQLCKALAHKGALIEFILPYTARHEVDFMRVTAAHPQDVTEVLRAGIAYDSFKYVKAGGGVTWHDTFGQSVLYEQSVAKMTTLAEFDVIHAHDWLTFRAALRAKASTNKPLIVHIHSVESDRAGGAYGNPLVREVEQLALTMADRIIAVSRHTRQTIVRDYGIPASKIDVVHNSIDPSAEMTLDPDNAYRYLAVMKRLGYRVVVNVGRLTMQKGLPNLLRAMQEVIQREPKTFLLIVGSGEQEYELVEQAAELGIGDKVLFAGFQRGKNWRDAFAIADLFVMPSISEPFGLTPLEAISFGTPVLISKQSGVSEVLTHCLKVDFWDVQEMANQIIAVIQSDALRDHLHANSLKEYQRLSWNDAADKLVAIYRRQVRVA